MLGKLREQVVATPGAQEETRVITVRLPKSLHDALKAEAHEYRTSMNRLCISKLLQFIEDELVPADS
jgi:predicted HicB family RNase H-like nuclease